MAFTRDLQLADGRNLRVYDTGDGSASDAFTIVWHHGTPQTGALLEPLVSAAAARGIRVLSYGRPSYGGSSPNRGRDIASAAGDVRQLTDALGVERFAVMGSSGGASHALASAALMPDRVLAFAGFGTVAPFTDSFDWFGGMTAPGALQAARQGLRAREEYAETEEFDESIFVAADWAALEGAWNSMGVDAGRAGADGPEGGIDDDLAYVRPWGFDVTVIEAPMLVAQGGSDRVIPPGHGDWLVRNCPSAELWLRPKDGHISILGACPVAMDWLRYHGAPA